MSNNLEGPVNDPLRSPALQQRRSSGQDEEDDEDLGYVSPKHQPQDASETRQEQGEAGSSSAPHFDEHEYSGQQKVILAIPTPSSSRRNPRRHSRQISSSSQSSLASASSPNINRNRSGSTPNATGGATLTPGGQSASRFSWMVDFGSLSPGQILANIASYNPFNRRRSRDTVGSNNSPNASGRSTPSAFDIVDASAGEDKPVAKLLNGTLRATCKPKELIELASFGMVEIEVFEPGEGHDFKWFRDTNPTFCDSCGDLIWMPISASNGQQPEQELNQEVPLDAASLPSVANPGTLTRSQLFVVQCTYCKYVCHLRCRQYVRVNCRGPAEQPRILDTASRPPSPQVNIESSELQRKIDAYNEKLKARGSGLGMVLLDNGKTFRGFLRVHLNLTRPINVVAGTRPPSIYDIIEEDDPQNTLARKKTLTSFYLPRDTVKNIHITSENTTLDVIQAMLRKFKIVDSAQKFALYSRYYIESENPKTGRKSTKQVLKRISHNDNPLRLALEWGCRSEEEGEFDANELGTSPGTLLESETSSSSKKRRWKKRDFVLQENDTADICWDAFQVPELKNFLRILDREEKEYVLDLKEKYKFMRKQLDIFIKEREMQEAAER